jgi:ligand-binding sensor domain-containing protein/serine phosphatase RsbU (regulator of sigma subunit)
VFTKSHTNNTILRFILFFTVLLFCFSCSNNPTISSEQAKQENQNAAAPPLVTVLANLADSSKPKVFLLEKTPKPQTITIPKVAGTSYTQQTKSGPKKIELTPPKTTPLAVLKNKNGEVIKDTDGKPFILGEGGTSTFSNYTTDQGLALDAVSCAFTDKVGNLWFGTWGGGLSRYDGKSFTNFTTAQGLANNGVRCITEDKAGNLWFGTYGGGVSCYDGKSFTNFTSAQGLANNRVMSIKEDKTGNIWLGTEGGGVSRYDVNRANAPCNKNTCKHDLLLQQDLTEHNKELAKSFTNFTTANGLVNNEVKAIAQDKIGNLWFGTNAGVSCYAEHLSSDKEMSGTKGRFTNYTTDDGLAYNVVSCIIEDKMGNLWFGTEGGGLSRYNSEQSAASAKGAHTATFINYTTAQGLGNNNVRSMTEDKNGNLWLGTYGGGVSCYNGKSFNSFTVTQGLANNTIWGITEDNAGNIWFATDGGGVCRYDGKAFTNFTPAQGLAFNIVWTILEDKTGTLWFGTSGGGVSRYDGKSLTNYTPAQGLADKGVRCIIEDKKGNIWFGTYGGGVSCYNGTSFTNYTTAQGLADNTIWSMWEDKTGTIWFGTNGGGVSRFDGTSFTNFTTAQGLTNNIVSKISGDQKGCLWFGTNGGGLSRYDGKSFTNFTTAQGLAGNAIMSIKEDKTGNLWFGTNGGGVSRYDGKSFINYTTAQGLPDNVVTQIVITKENNIALGTNLGVGMLVSFSPKEALNTAEGLQDKSLQTSLPAQNKLSNEELKNFSPLIEIYNSNNGYPVKDVNTGQNGMFEDSKGIIWAGTGSDKTALMRFDYAALNKNKNTPQIFIQNIKINNENLCWNNLQASTLKVKNITKSVETDNTAIPANVAEEITTFGKTLNDAERAAMRQKFKDIKFEGITPFYPIPEHLVLPYAQDNITFEFAAIEPAKPYLVRYQYKLEGYDDNWSPITNKTSAAFGNMFEGTYTFKLKAQSPYGVWSQPIEYTFTVLPPWWRTWWMYCLYGISAIALVILIVRLNGRRLRARATELSNEVEKATQTIREKQKEIIDSITYAKRIQTALLTSDEYIKNNFPGEHFILFKPKDIVSGDFYWAQSIAFLPGWDIGTNKVRVEPHTKRKNIFYIATADCTGHGVPGAFMSMLNISYLNENLIERNIRLPHDILDAQRAKIIQTLNPPGSIQESKDGMDCTLCVYDFDKMLLHFAAANNPLWLVRNFELTEYKADKMPVGKYTEAMHPFTMQTIELQTGDVIYTSTDGFADQFGTKGKKMMKKRFKEELLKIHQLPLNEQKEKLHQFFENWKGNNEQVDDVCVIGIRI